MRNHGDRIETEGEPDAFFVYGTLKRGHPNHGVLAPYVRSITPAWMRGALYSTGDFPALVDGTDVVRGELICLSPDDISRVLPIIDRLEGYFANAPEHSLYLRRVAEVTTHTGTRQPAYTYFYNERCPAVPPVTMLVRIASGEWTGSMYG